MAHSAILNVLSDTLVKAGRGMLRDFGEVDHLQVSRKGVANFVTKSDLRTEKFLHKELSKARPSYGFLMEESGEIKGEDAHYRWIIDPLDGTNNFIHAVPYFCISVALEERKGDRHSIIAGAIYDPVHNELFMAEKNKGAFLNDRKISVSRREAWDEVMMVTGNMRMMPKDHNYANRLLDAISAKGTTIRSFGATALDLANMAAGRYDACWFYSGQPWDYAAGMLIAREAGAVITDFAGNPVDSYAQSVLASTPQLSGEIQKMIAKPAA